jgi:hypothetical protein
MTLFIILTSCGVQAEWKDPDPCNKSGPDVCVTNERGDYECSKDRGEK